ncbi:hypothetical protein [Nocardia beijingensis]|uniref:hypothetical protein n=1 Tax=Nocardia beijingensis TaxID=95162 RepID=UPI0033ABC8C8
MVGGITMPDRLGQCVRDDMLFRGQAIGPVVAHIRSRRWTFLCRPDLPDDVRLFAALFRIDVRSCRSAAKSRCRLPPTRATPFADGWSRREIRFVRPEW